MEDTAPQTTEEATITLVQANMARRLVNYLVDFILFCFFVSILLVVVNPIYPLMQQIMQKKPIGLVDQIIINFFYGLYMAVVEALLKGKSIGKYLTGTRAVMLDGRPVNGQTAFTRGLIRVIPFPFEQLSAIGFPSYPLHDRWSKSMVVDESKSSLPKA